MGAASDRPGWLDLVLRLEREIGSRLERVVRSDEYFELTGQLNRARKRFSDRFEGVQEEWLHLFNVPAGTDVRRLREQLSRVERELETLTLRLADQDEEGAQAKQPKAKAKPRPRPRPQATSTDTDA
jgi:hypothetical protein